MAESFPDEIPEGAIRLRSYLIWQREGCCEGNALSHWLRAKAELEAEMGETLRALPPLRRQTPFVVPRPVISMPPTKNISVRIETKESRSTSTASALPGNERQFYG